MPNDPFSNGKYITMITNNLDFFNSIEFYGRKQYTPGNSCLIKYRFTIDKGREIYKAWKKMASYIELKFHVTRDKQHVILGAELHTQAAVDFISLVRTFNKKKESAK